jgi:mannose-6-phosphate isomerase-like protein (cupin superfamily)
MFAFKASVMLAEFRTYQPQMLAVMEEIYGAEPNLSEADYRRLDNISIDYAIMEQTAKCVVVPSDFGWSDIGSWKSLYDFLEKDADQNVVDGDVIVRNTHNCFILGGERLIAANHLRDMVVVETPDSVFISDLEHSRDVKSIVLELKARGRSEYHQHRSVYFPWGVSKLLEQNPAYRVAELNVYKGSRLQVQINADERLHLVVVKGRAAIAAGSEKTVLDAGAAFSFETDERTEIDIENISDQPLSLIQTQWERAGG